MEIRPLLRRCRSASGADARARHHGRCRPSAVRAHGAGTRTHGAHRRKHQPPSCHDRVEGRRGRTLGEYRDRLLGQELCRSARRAGRNVPDRILGGRHHTQSEPLRVRRSHRTGIRTRTDRRDRMFDGRRPSFVCLPLPGGFDPKHRPPKIRPRPAATARRRDAHRHEPRTGIR